MAEIPLRQDPVTPDGFDGERLKLVHERWSAQDGALLARDRQIEENLRMLAGRQWDLWSDLLGTFVDPTRYMTDDERRWRQRPVVNVLQYWFMLTHARLTESAPIITYQPSTADRKDAMLAECMDTVGKTLWYEMDMDEVDARATAFQIAAGEVYYETIADFTVNQQSQKPLTGPAVLSMDSGDGPIERVIPSAPYDASGNAMLDEQGEPSGEPAMQSDGEPRVIVRSPLEVRAEWGSSIPWVNKRWITTVSYLTEDQIEQTYGVEISGADVIQADAGYLQRLLFGAGYFGAVSKGALSGTGGEQEQAKGYVPVWTMWEKPCEDYPDGRMLVVTKTQVLRDSVRPAAFACAGPIRRAQFVQMPGRGGFGSTPLEQMIPIQKAYNRGWAQILEHRNLCTNPVAVFDINSGLAEQWSNRPGLAVEADFAAAGGRDPVYFVTPPALPADVWRTQDMLLTQLMMLGSMHGAEGTSPTDNASGELVTQLRFNADRPVSIAARSRAIALAEVYEDVVALLPTVWTQEKIIAHAGEDSVIRTITVMPEVLSGGRVNVRPDMGSARLDTPQAKKEEAFRDYQAGVFGPPGDPTAGKIYMEVAGIARPNRDSLPGAADQRTAEQNLGKIAQGAKALEIPLFPWYQYPVFLEVTRNFLASPDFLQMETPVQAEFNTYWQMLNGAQAAAMAQQIQQQAPMAAMVAAAQGTVAQVGHAHAPVPPEAAQGSGSPPAASTKPGAQAA